VTVNPDGSFTFSPTFYNSNASASFSDSVVVTLQASNGITYTFARDGWLSGGTCTANTCCNDTTTVCDATICGQTCDANNDCTPNCCAQTNWVCNDPNVNCGETCGIGVDGIDVTNSSAAMAAAWDDLKKGVVATQSSGLNTTSATLWKKMPAYRQGPVWHVYGYLP